MDDFVQMNATNSIHVYLHISMLNKLNIKSISRFIRMQWINLYSKNFGGPHTKILEKYIIQKPIFLLNQETYLLETLKEKDIYIYIY